MLPIMLALSGTLSFRPVDAHPNPRQDGVHIMLKCLPARLRSSVPGILQDSYGETSRKHQRFRQARGLASART